MRRSLAAAAAAVVFATACGGEPKGLVPVSAAGSGSQSGPDALVLRVPLAGGTPQVYAYTHLDSVVWSGSGSAPAVDRVLAFDEQAGAIVFADSKERPVRLDFRLGASDHVSADPVLGATSADGAAVYGTDENGNVVRFTVSANWTYKPPHPARAVFPQDDGSLLVVGGRDAQTRVWKLYPPDSKIVDSATFPSTWRPLPDQAGERLYVIVDSGLASLATRTLDWNKPVGFDAHIAAAVSTPSGDRVFVLTDSSRRIDVVDRYRNDVVDHITLPSPARDLRVDPLGRYLLARAAVGDSAWVVAVGTYHVLGSVATGWRTDLPFVGLDGAIALWQGGHVTFIDGETLRPAKRISGGASDFWYPFRWNGFRPRASSLDQPVSFNLASADSARTAIDAAAADSAARAAQRPAAATQPAGRTPSRDTVTAQVGYLVSFAALLNQSRAQDLASQITVEGRKARIVVSVRNNTPIYRVVLGPYPTRDEAERVGRASQQTYWVYEATP